MLKKISFALLVVLMLISVISCATVVNVSYMRPSTINMGSYRNIAIASTVPYRGSYMNSSMYMRYYDTYSAPFRVYSSYSSSLPRRVAEYADSQIMSALSQDSYFSIMHPAETDAIIAQSRYGINPSSTFVSRGIDAVIIPSVDIMTVDEYSRVYIDSYERYYDPYLGYYVEEPEYKYVYYQKVEIKLTLTVIDTKTDRIIASQSYSASDGYNEYDYTSRVTYGSMSYVYTNINDPYYSFRTLLNRFRSSITRDFMPTRQNFKIELMANKPKVESLESAYQAAEDGNLSIAYNAFLAEWNASGHIPSAYNAAAIQASQGDIDGALTLLNSAKSHSSDSKLISLYNSLVSVKSSNAQAAAQLSGGTPNNSTYSSTQALYSIYDSIIR